MQGIFAALLASWLLPEPADDEDEAEFYPWQRVILGFGLGTGLLNGLLFWLLLLILGKGISWWHLPDNMGRFFYAWLFIWRLVCLAAFSTLAQAYGFYFGSHFAAGDVLFYGYYFRFFQLQYAFAQFADDFDGAVGARYFDSFVCFAACKGRQNGFCG